MLTIGVAIPIPDPWGPVLDAARARTGDPQAVHVPSHVTLLGPTEIASDGLGEVENHLAACAAEHHPFELHLRGTGTFRPITEVVFVTVAMGISECETLESAVRTGPLAKELNYPYHPHVTVAQAVDTPALDAAFEELADFEAQFTVDGFVLYTHDDDATWRPRRAFGFGAAARWATIDA
ncbi:MAG TPA: 2'-5' RNA ligase family protein [Stackebrandtia sp.]|jgi:2'-5' RNA ligase|uniref:2'-5' RNA ligase family protein n=1 Tax=Stackebrandtia sp. TaxID=2023065 RepID=UPI002D3DC7BF|nr:2'-5' RNA ligase family protein [Stackebrandtia sp.]HZE38957.1 2'-5' RNA ligase family protein [Stackebrandtia sp.]